MPLEPDETALFLHYIQEQRARLDKLEAALLECTKELKHAANGSKGNVPVWNVPEGSSGNED